MNKQSHGQLLLVRPGAPGVVQEGTYISHHVPINADKLCELAVALVYFTCSPPEACGHTHCREYAVIVE